MPAEEEDGWLRTPHASVPVLCAQCCSTLPQAQTQWAGLLLPGPMALPRASGETYILSRSPPLLRPPPSTCHILVTVGWTLRELPTHNTPPQAQPEKPGPRCLQCVSTCTRV